MDTESNVRPLGGDTLAVEGEHVYFHFDRKNTSPVLNAVDIAVPRGVIYSLIGPSGCGKTTLLKCIVGRYKVQGGFLQVYGRVPGSKDFFIPGPGIGYMPQDLALHVEMTAKETLAYFGYLNGMRKRELKERISFLAQLLALADTKKQLKYLSGGQQRRVSFAVALVHRPPLLILDEPTVGVDPLLRRSIWEHMSDLVKNDGTTIIITTHYVEEARQAQIVGFMRDGRLLAECDPEVLIKKYSAATLEEVFLRLCQGNYSNDDCLATRPGAVTAVKSHSPNCSSQKYAALWLTNEDGERQCASTEKPNYSFGADDNNSNGKFHEVNNCYDNATALLSPSSLPKEFGHRKYKLQDSWVRFSSMTKKNLLYLRRNYFLMVFQLFIPTIQVAIFCLCVGADPFDLSVAVVNMEKEQSVFSNKYLTALSNRTIYQRHFDNLSLAVDSVRNGESWAAMYIGPKFSTCLLERFFQGPDVSNETVDCSTIKLYLDMSNQQIIGTLFTHLLRRFESFAFDILEEVDGNPLLVSPPVKLQNPIYGTVTTTFTEFMAPGIILAITYIMSVGLTGMGVIVEKKRGLLERTRVAGATAVELLLSLFVSAMLTMIGQVALVLSFTFWVFNIPCNGPFFWVAVIVFLVAVHGMSFGLLLTTVCDDEFPAVMLAMGSFYPTIFLSGLIWPMDAMPYYLRYFGYCLPLTLITDSMRCILTRGWNITNRHIWDGYLICIAWTVLLLIVAMIVFKFRK